MAQAVKAETRTKTTKTKKEKRPILHRTQKWPLQLTGEQEELLYKISDGLREYYNLALLWQQESYKTYKEAIKIDPRQKEVKAFLTAFDCYTLYKDVQRPSDTGAGLFRAKIPTNWVLETFRQVEGAYKSFFELGKKGDSDARTPKERSPEYFQVIPGALSASFKLSNNMMQLAPRSFDGLLCFHVERHQAQEMATATRFAKFTIARTDNRLSKKGLLTMSLAYEIEQPAEQPFVPAEAVYVSLGVNSLGVVSPKGKTTIPLLRPDKHWKTTADEVADRTGALIDAKQLKKRSRKHRRQQGARATVYNQMSKQQQLNRREIVVRELLEWTKEKPMTKQERRFHRRRDRLPDDGQKTVVGGRGIHFVVTELVVRSKEGKLADAEQAERGGRNGLNWGAQNTGTIAYLVSWLTEKVKEHGGSVRRLALNPSYFPPETIALAEDEQQIKIAQKLRDEFLRQPEKAQIL